MKNTKELEEEFIQDLKTISIGSNKYYVGGLVEVIRINENKFLTNDLPIPINHILRFMVSFKRKIDKSLKLVPPTL